jgi:hypothetical protein
VAWKLIKGNLYYYESRRVDGRARSTYIGAGPAAEILEILAQLKRVRRAEKQSDERIRQRMMAEEDSRLARWCRGIEILFRAAMENAGHHQHARGPWRKRRMGKATKKGHESAAEAPATGPRTFSDDDAIRICERAEAGDRSAIPDVQDLLESPDWRDLLLRISGSSSRMLDEALIGSVAGSRTCWSRRR